MSGDVHARFWESVGVRFPRATSSLRNVDVAVGMSGSPKTPEACRIRPECKGKSAWSRYASGPSATDNRRSRSLAGASKVTMIQPKPAFGDQGDVSSVSELYRSPRRLEASCTEPPGDLW